MKAIARQAYGPPETPRALGYLGEGHARGKVVISGGAAPENDPTTRKE
jgi:hypothetical protein